MLPPWEGPAPTFLGFRRPDGRVGVRNWVLIVPTSMCSSHEAPMIALQAEMGGIYSREKYPNVDGVTAIPHTRGCGCPDMELGAARSGRLIGVVEAACACWGATSSIPTSARCWSSSWGARRRTCRSSGRYIGPAPPPVDSARPALVADFGAAHGKPVVTHERAAERRHAWRPSGAGWSCCPSCWRRRTATARTPCHASELAVGLKCGGSDAFSGLTANPALGVAPATCSCAPAARR